jgi:hypothetical protein
MATAVRKATAKKVVQSVPVTVEVTATSKATAAERLDMVLTLIDRQSTAPTIDGVVQVKYGKAIPLVGGGSVYINRSNADVRGTTGQVQAWLKVVKGSTARGPQGQYLRIPFTK